MGNVTFDSAEFSDVAPFGGVQFAGNAGFNNVRFLKGAIFSQAKFLGSAKFANAAFSSDVNFNSVKFERDTSFESVVFGQRAEFQSAEFAGRTYFQRARFETRVPTFFETTFHEYTDWHDAKWPSVPDDTNEAREQVHYYQRLALVMNKLEKPDDRNFFFRQEMRARRRAEGRGVARVLNWFYEFVCDYGSGLARISAFWFGHVIIGAILICAARVIGPLQNGLSRQETYEFVCNLPQAFAISLSNAHSFLGLNRGFLQDTIKDWADVPFFNLIGGFQTVLGIIFLFFLLLTIRNRFRMR